MNEPLPLPSDRSGLKGLQAVSGLTGSRERTAGARSTPHFSDFVELDQHDDDIRRFVAFGPKPEKRSARENRIFQTCSKTLALAGAMLMFAPALSADSLWREETASPLSMFSDKRAGRVGDIVTILVQETSTATKDNSTKTSKQSSVDAALASFLFSPAASGLMTKGGALPTLKFANKSDFSGGGQINNSQQIVASVAVRIVDVLPNRNLLIEGTRDSAFSGEQQTILLRGTIRQDDIMANNTIYSYNVADATIKIISKGTITDSQRKGWFHKFWDKFSPF